MGLGQGKIGTDHRGFTSQSRLGVFRDRVWVQGKSLSKLSRGHIFGKGRRKRRKLWEKKKKTLNPCRSVYPRELSQPDLVQELPPGKFMGQGQGKGERRLE